MPNIDYFYIVKPINEQIEEQLLRLNAGVDIPVNEELYHFIVQDEDGAQVRTARNKGKGWFLQKH